MKKLYALGAALIAVCMFGVFSVAFASAAVETLLAEWLDNGVGLTSSVPSDIEGETLNEETILGIKIDILCSVILDGTLGVNGEDTITEVLTLGLILVAATPLVEPGLLCANTENCVEPLVWWDNLPWKTLLVLLVDGEETFFADFIFNGGKGTASDHMVCMGSGTADLCEFNPAIVKVTNTAEGVDEEASEAFTELARLKLSNCEIAGSEKGITEGLAFVLFTETGLGPLTASSE